MSSNGGKKAGLVHISSVAVALSVLIAPSVLAMKASFDMPACDRMTSEAAVADPSADLNLGPVTTQTVDTATKSAGKEAGNTKAAKGETKGILKPLKLTDDSDNVKVGKDGKVKLKAERNVKTQDTPGAGELYSNEAKINNKLLKQAKKENIAPLALIESEGETQQKLDIIGECDRQQLTDLWSSTINRSPDVQFVINRMQPHSDPNHATSTVIKLLSGVLFSAAQAVPMMMGPGVGSMVGYASIGSGSSVVSQLLYGNDQKNQKKQQISQEQATMLYKMVRDTADKLVIEFRNYKKCRSQFDRASKLLDDIKTMVAAARDSQDAAKQIDMEYTIRKAQHDLDDITDDARLHRQQLCDLAGADAVAKLDEQIDEEALAVANATGGGAVADGQPAANPPAAADKPAESKKQLAGNAQPKSN